MPRIKLVEQQEYEFHFTITIQPRDINVGRHLGNDALISLVGAARAAIFHSMSMNELDLGSAQTGMIMSDLTVNYLAEAFLFDELFIDTHIGELGRNGSRLFHRITRKETVIALVETGLITFNYVSKKIVPVPETFLKRLKQQRA
jgi:acyl-CoA thioester hydrolase